MRRARVNPRHLDARLMAIYQAIRSGHYPNANQLARALEVGTRTIKRDLEHLREGLGLDITYDAIRHGYFLADPDAAFPGGPFSEAEILALFVARQSLAAQRGTAVERILAEGFRRLESRLDGQQRYWLGDVGALVSFRAPAPEELAAEVFHELLGALRDRRELRFQYQGLSDPAPRTRQVRGYHLGCVDQKWYLFGWDTDREALRTFALSRMTGLEVTACRFQPPADFDLTQTLAGAFG
ncbi:MAG: helix-turn-helix transcriptional regulator, partial [Verrucomicrobiota bacterium]